MFNDISMLIITKDRSYTLLPIIKYHAQTRIPLLIADSSENASSHAATLEKTENVRYFHCPEKSFHERAIFLLEHVTTPYCVFRADRRHQCNNAIAQCLAFLKEHPDYSSASGFWTLDKSRLLYYANNVLAKPWLFDNPTERVECHALSFESPFYNVHKTALAKLRFAILADLKTLSSHVYFLEYIDYFTMFFLGKTRHLSIFGGVVQDLSEPQCYEIDFFTTAEYLADKELVLATYNVIEKHLLAYGVDRITLREAFSKYIECISLRFLLHGFERQGRDFNLVKKFGHAEKILHMIREKNPHNTPFLLNALQTLLAFMTDNSMQVSNVLHLFSDTDQEAMSEITHLMSEIGRMRELDTIRAMKHKAVKGKAT